MIKANHDKNSIARLHALFSFRVVLSDNDIKNSGTPHHTAIIDIIPIKVNIMLFCFVGAFSPYLCLPFPISKSLPLFTSYFSPFTQYSSIFPQILLYHFTQMKNNLPKGEITVLVSHLSAPFIKIKKKCNSPFFSPASLFRSTH